MKIVLVRHGESGHNARMNDNKNSSLTKKGKIQAEHLGKRLKREKIKIDKIYTSNLIRSKQTAEIVSKIIKIPISKSFEEFSEYPSANLKNFFVRLLNLKLGRLKKLLDKITKAKGNNKIIMVVAHGVTIRIIIGYLLEMPLGKKLLRFFHHNTGISVLEWNKKHKNWRLTSMNDTSHLPEKLKWGKVYE